jgi:hypothetical protein
MVGKLEALNLEIIVMENLSIMFVQAMNEIRQWIGGN